MGLAVALAAFDAEREPGGGKGRDAAVDAEDPRRRVTGAGARDLARGGIDDEVRHRDELARRDLADDDVVRGGKEVAGLWVLAGERAEDELRHRHVRRRVDAVPRHVPQHDGEPAVVEREEVVDVASDLHPC